MKKIIILMIMLVLLVGCSKTFDECDINKDGNVDSREERMCGTDRGDCIVECLNNGDIPQKCLVSCGELSQESTTEVISGTEIIISSLSSHSFGIHPSALDEYEFAYDLGIDFNREGLYFMWVWIDKNKNEHYSFKNAMLTPHEDKPHAGGSYNYDNYRKKLSDGKNIEQMSNVCAFSRKVNENEFKSVEEEIAYQKFVEKLTERYDGDSDFGCTLEAPDCYNEGDNEYPEQEVIDSLELNPIKYWQACNQVTDVCINDCQATYAEKYAKFMELTYKGVKASCSDCQVLIAGDSAPEMYPRVYESLNGNYVDIIDKHFFGTHNDYMKITEEMDYLKNSLVESGFDLSELRFWATEVGTYSGDPVEDRGDIVTEGPPYQSEKEHAQGLVKRFVYSFGEGIEKVLWAWGLVEAFGCDCCIFDYTGLIYDGNGEPQECDENDPYDLGKGVKKLAYYSFKLMTSKIGGFDTIEVVSESDFVYVYKLVNDGNPIWIGWSEGGEKSVSIDIDADAVIVTESVPKYETGQEVSDFDSAFNSYELDTQDGKIEIVLNEVPVYVEIIS